jgi:pimeloyl-ACP methyl ester carboxylesterase
MYPRVMSPTAPPPPETAPQTLMVRTPSLEIAVDSWGPAAGFPVIGLHGFPDDARAWDAVAPPLVAAGYRVLAPYLRGYGPTRFLDPAAPRMAQQAAIGQDLLDLMDALGLPRVALVGYDWGGRAACITAILAPARVRTLVTIGGYNVQNTVRRAPPGGPDEGRRLWYQWYFNTERGRAGLAVNRHALCRLLWEEWSPTWRFDDVTYDRTAASFDNPDFVEIVIHSYRHRHGNAPGDPRLDAIERRLAERPPITVPSVILHGADDAVDRAPSTEGHLARFPAGTERHVVPGAGHFLPREKPQVVADALLRLLSQSS